nr:glycoside hydrolase family 108 protein [Methylobacterium sp. ZNC0032]
MSAENFVPALSGVLVHEGGWSNHKADPGGATMKGVTQRVYDAYRRRRDLQPQSVRLITEVELRDIYRKQYWDAVKGDKLPDGLDYAVFDGAVNSGPSQSVKWLQRALGTVKVDGVIGEATLAAVEAYPDHDRLIAIMLDRRLAFLKALRIWPVFRGGWTARIAQVEQIGQAWATGSVAPKPIFFAGGNAKATIDQAMPLPAKGGADAATGAGISSGSLGGVLEAARQQLEPLAGASTVIGYVVTALVVTGVLMTAGGFAYRAYASHKARARADALDLPDGVVA